FSCLIGAAAPLACFVRRRSSDQASRRAHSSESRAAFGCHSHSRRRRTCKSTHPARQSPCTCARVVLMRRAARLLVLAVLITTLAGIVRQRGFGLHLGGAPAALRGPYATEESWIVGEIVRDITEM